MALTTEQMNRYMELDSKPRLTNDEINEYMSLDEAASAKPTQEATSPPKAPAAPATPDIPPVPAVQTPSAAPVQLPEEQKGLQYPPPSSNVSVMNPYAEYPVTGAVRAFLEGDTGGLGGRAADLALQYNPEPTPGRGDMPKSYHEAYQAAGQYYPAMKMAGQIASPINEFIPGGPEGAGALKMLQRGATRALGGAGQGVAFEASDAADKGEFPVGAAVGGALGFAGLGAIGDVATGLAKRIPYESLAGKASSLIDRVGNYIGLGPKTIQDLHADPEAAKRFIDQFANVSDPFWGSTEKELGLMTPKSEISARAARAYGATNEAAQKMFTDVASEKTMPVTEVLDYLDKKIAEEATKGEPNQFLVSLRAKYKEALDQGLKSGAAPDIPITQLAQDPRRVMEMSKSFKPNEPGMFQGPEQAAAAARAMDDLAVSKGFEGVPAEDLDAYERLRATAKERSQIKGAIAEPAQATAGRPPVDVGGASLNPSGLPRVFGSVTKAGHERLQSFMIGRDLRSLQNVSSQLDEALQKGGVTPSGQSINPFDAMRLKKEVEALMKLPDEDRVAYQYVLSQTNPLWAKIGEYFGGND